MFVYACNTIYKIRVVFPIHLDTHTHTHTHGIMHNFFSLFVVYCDLDLKKNFFLFLLLIQTIQIHFSVHLIFFARFFLRRWIMCVHSSHTTYAYTEMSKHYDNSWWWWGCALSFTIFSMPNRGYDFPMREHLTFWEHNSRYYLTEFCSYCYVSMLRCMIVCLFVCLHAWCLPAYLFQFI